jgi:hypothetical protein
MSLLLWMNPAILVAKGGPSWHGKQDWHSLEHGTQRVEINCGRDSVSSLCVSVAWHRVFFSGFVLVKGIEAWKERWWHALGCIQSFLHLKQHWIQPSTHRRLNRVLVGMEQGRKRIWQRGLNGKERGKLSVQCWILLDACLEIPSSMSSHFNHQELWNISAQLLAFTLSRSCSQKKEVLQILMDFAWLQLSIAGMCNVMLSCCSLICLMLHWSPDLVF